MRILVNGNLGYIGPIVIRHFRAAFPDATIIGFDSGFFKDCLIDKDRFPKTLPDKQFYGDVRKMPDEVLQNVDAIVQLAAISNDPMGNAFQKVTADINATATLAVARRAQAAGVKAFVFASSCSVYGAGGDDAKDETSPVDPLTAYAKSKIEAEKELETLASGDFKVTCLRFATACGFSPRIRLDLVLNDFVASAIATGKIVILSDGTPWRPLIHVKDMARAMEWGINRDVDRGGHYLVVNVGSNDWNYRVLELAKAVQEQLENVEIVMSKNAASDKRSYRVDFGLFGKLAPSHLPKETLFSAIVDLAEGLQASGFADPEFRASRYIRLKVLTDLRTSGKLSEELFWKAAQ